MSIDKSDPKPEPLHSKSPSDPEPEGYSKPTSDPTVEPKSIARAAGLLGGGTLTSRILGFARDVIIARFFGTAIAAQAFVVAFRIPNLLRGLVAEGATNAAFVPVFTEYTTKRSKEEFWELARTVLNILLPVLLAVTALGILLSPIIVRAMAPGFIKDPQKLALTIRLTRFMFPYILLIGLTAYCVGVLNSLKHFAGPAFAPGTMNVCIIVSCVALYPLLKEPVMALAIGVLLGGISQLSINLSIVFKKGLRIKRRLRFRHPAAKRIGELLLPRVLGACVYQVNIFVDTILASLAFVVGEGGVAALYYSNRIIQFPMAVFGVAIATAALPAMSTHAANKDPARLKKTLLFSLRGILFITTPATIGILILARPIVMTLFQRGQFGPYSTSITSLALFFYAFGLFAFAGIKILVYCFYSMQDTLTPVKVASISVLVNLVLNLILMWPLKVGGLALATSLSASLNFFLLLRVLRKKIGGLDLKRLGSSFLRILAAALIMGAACWFLADKLIVGLEGRTLQNLIGLPVVILTSVSIYLAASFFFKVEETRKLTGWVLGK